MTKGEMYSLLIKPTLLAPSFMMNRSTAILELIPAPIIGTTSVDPANLEVVNPDPGAGTNSKG